MARILSIIALAMKTTQYDATHSLHNILAPPQGSATVQEPPPPTHMRQANGHKLMQRVFCTLPNWHQVLLSRVLRLMAGVCNSSRHSDQPWHSRPTSSTPSRAGAPSIRCAPCQPDTRKAVMCCYIFSEPAGRTCVNRGRK
jgi:hypothetical protein